MPKRCLAMEEPSSLSIEGSVCGPLALGMLRLEGIAMFKHVKCWKMSWYLGVPEAHVQSSFTDARLA